MWIVTPSTCYPCAPASAGSTSELSLPQAERLASSVTLSGKLSPPRSWQRAWKMKPWLARLSGATCEPSTAARGVELWIASLADTRANRSASPASVVERTILATFGRKSLESLRRSNPASCSSRTSEDTYRSGSTMFPVTFTDWATALRRDCLQRRKSARRTSGNGCSSSAWHTPKVARGAYSYANGDHNKPVLNLAGQSVMWSSPRTSDTNGAGQHGAGGVDLRTQVDAWPTPGATEREDSLPDQAAHWQTPATDSFRSRGGDRKDEMGLDQQARVFPSSPPDQEHAPSGSESCESGPTLRPRLNPAFVEWLMGWPLGWTDFAPVGTASSVWWRQQHSCLYGLVCGRNEK